jgi:hypothetical protein
MYGARTTLKKDTTASLSCTPLYTGYRSDACMPSPLARSCTQREWMCVSSLHQLKLPGDWASAANTYYQCSSSLVPPHSGRHRLVLSPAAACVQIRSYDAICHRAGRPDASSKFPKRCPLFPDDAACVPANASDQCMHRTARAHLASSPPWARRARPAACGSRVSSQDQIQTA